MLSAVAVAVLIAGIQRSCACTGFIDALAARVSMPVSVVVAVSVSMMTADETYQQNRTQADGTVKHCGQSDELKSRHGCLHEATYLFNRRFRMLNFNDCARFFDNAGFSGVSMLWRQPGLRLRLRCSASESRFQPLHSKIDYDISTPIFCQRSTRH